MKALFYALFLLAVLVGSVLFLRSIDRPERRVPERVAPVVESLSPPSSSRPSTEAASADELREMGDELFDLWHVAEATDVFEQAVAADSAHYAAWVRLVECYAHPLICREDAAREAWRHASAHVPSDNDTLFLAGIRDLFIDRDYDAAVGDFTAARRVEVSHPDVDYYLALSYYLAGRIDAAESHLEDLLTEDDTVGRVVELSVRTKVVRGELDAAASRARDLARAYAGEPFPYVLLSQIEMLRGEMASAAEFCNNALVLDARYIPAILARAHLYVAEHQMAPARVSFEKLLLFDDLILRAAGQEGIAFVDFLDGDFGAGVAAMDEAIRDAIMAGSVRRALSYASQLVAYLCELGQAEEAAGVIQRWVTGFGDVPVRVGNLRVDILRGDVNAARRTLVEIRTNRQWLVWSRALSLDFTELLALTHVAAGEQDAALKLLDAGEPGVGAGARARRAFLRGYVAFENGRAEVARISFEDARANLFGVEFPYHGDPVLGVQSLFYIAESVIAAGDATGAQTYYTDFLSYWGDPEWDLPAVARARERLSGPGQSPESP